MLLLPGWVPSCLLLEVRVASVSSSWDWGCHNPALLLCWGTTRVGLAVPVTAPDVWGPFVLICESWEQHLPLVQCIESLWVCSACVPTDFSLGIFRVPERCVSWALTASAPAFASLYSQMPSHLSVDTAC